MVVGVDEREIQTNCGTRTAIKNFAADPTLVHTPTTLSLEMPKEHRKRGKKHKKSEKQDEYAQYENQAPENQAVELQNDGAPSWIRPAQETSEFNPEAPFGYVDADVKAYFRTVDTQMRDWQESRDAEEENEDANPGEGAFSRSFRGLFSFLL